MSHLGERLTALVDDELGPAERDRALAHLAGCGECRAEADALRELKGRLRSAGETAPPAGLLAQLRELSEPGEPLAPAARPFPGISRPGTSRKRDRGNVLFLPAAAAAWSLPSLPRTRYLVAGAATLAVLGVGGLSFAAGGERGNTPRIAPAVERYAVEHSRRSGEIPLPDPSPVETVGVKKP